MAFLYYIVEEEQGGALPTSPPGEAYTQVDDDTMWQDDDLGTSTGTIVYGASWTITSVGQGTTKTKSLEPIGTWYVNFRPTGIRVTFGAGWPENMGNNPTVSLGGGDDNVSLGHLGSGVYQISPIDEDPGDITQITFDILSSSTGLTLVVDKIEFLFDPANPPISSGDWGLGGGEGGEG